MIASRFRIRTVALAGIAALALIGAALAADQTTAYLRIHVSDKTFVYVQAQGSEIRVAMSADGLKAATPIKQDAEIALPIPAEQLPKGVTAVKATFTVTQMKSRGKTTPFFSGMLTTCRTDDKKAQWQYIQRIPLTGGAAAESAPALNLPDLDKLALKLETKSSNGKLGVGLHLTAGDVELSGLIRDGKAVEMEVSVKDSSGAQVASKTGDLADFGFSWGGPCYSVGVADGDYTCAATLDLGGGAALKDKAEVTVP